MLQYQIFELVFQGEEPAGSWTEVDLRGTFICQGIKKVNKRKPQQFLGEIIVKHIRNHVHDFGWHNIWVTDRMNLRFKYE